MSLFLSRAALALALPAVLLAAGCDSTDDGPDTTAELGVYATSNPDGLSSDSVVRLAADLSASQATFGGLTGVASVQSVAFDGSGNAFLTVDLAGTLGGIVYVPGLCDRSDEGCTNAGTSIGAGARLVSGLSTGLVAPKGLIVAGSRVIVADQGSSSIRVFSTAATGNQAPEFTVTDLGAGASVWDAEYDAAGDRLYVASTNGLVLVYDSFLSDRGADGPDRTITPADDDGDQISVNLHGIAYDRSRDLLIVSDVGSASSATDGQLFTIASASTASGTTAVRYRVSGGATQLGNPVDLTLASNGRVYVAEKSNDRVMRFDNLLTATGSSSAAAAAAVAVESAESVSISN